MHSQNSLLERDLNKRDSLAGRRRDSVNDKGLKISDLKRAKDLAFEQTLQVLTMIFDFCSDICDATSNLFYLYISIDRSGEVCLK